MISLEQVQEARRHRDEAEETIRQYNKEQMEAFELRLKENPIFTDEELRYSAETLCPCGHGIAYPIACGPFHYWDCSAILKGIADTNIKHTGQLPFTTYEVKSEGEGKGTTRGVFRPKPVST